MMLNEYNNSSPLMMKQKINLDKYQTKINNKNQLFIICNDPIDFDLLLSILLSDSKIHYICWISTKDFNETILKLLVITHRDTFVGLLNINNNYSNHFIVVQKSKFAFQFLHFMKKYQSQWNQILQMIIDSKSNNNIFYTSLFTIHYDQINCIPCVENTLTNTKGTNGNPIIFQTWISHFTNQNRLISCFDKINVIYPKHDHVLFSDFEMKQFILSHYDDNVYNVYDNIIPSAFKSDFFRYLYLYKYGGLYLDIPLYPVINVFDYISVKYPNKNVSFFSAIDNGHPTYIWNAFMYAVPNHPIMKTCIDHILSYQHMNPKPVKSCLEYTGPGLLGKAFQEYIKNNDDVLLFNHNAAIGQILDGTQSLFETKNSKKVHTDMTTKRMYTESNKTHYSLHCIHKKVFYD
jgi:mannosyltransferase OCH1-like enzyme